MYLSDLVRMGFMAATDNNTQLRMAGLEALHVSNLILMQVTPSNKIVRISDCHQPVQGCP